MEKRDGIIRILSYFAPFKKELIIALCLLVSTTAIGFFHPRVIRIITDNGMLGRNMQVLYQSAVAMVMLVVLSQIVEMVQTRLFVNIHNKAYYNIFHQVFQKLMRLKKTYFEDKNNAEILSCLQMDVSQVAQCH